jgi:hypothetical protein
MDILRLSVNIQGYLFSSFRFERIGDRRISGSLATFRQSTAWGITSVFSSYNKFKRLYEAMIKVNCYKLF